MFLYLARDLSAGSLLGKLPRLLAILGGHLIVFGTFVALGAARGGSELRRLYTTRTALDDGDRVRFLLIVFTACATLWTIAMTVYFTAQATNVVPTDYFRLHGRYYSFVIPLYLVLFFGLSRDSAEADAKDSWLLTGTIIGCGLSVLLYYVASRRTIYPFDYPEAAVFSGWHGAPGSGLATLSVDAVTHIGIGIALVGYAVMLWRRHLARVVYPILLIALFSVSTARVTAWQRTNSIKNAGLRADARSMQKLLAVSERDNGLVVGPDWNGRTRVFPLQFRIVGPRACSSRRLGHHDSGFASGHPLGRAPRGVHSSVPSGRRVLHAANEADQGGGRRNVTARLATAGRPAPRRP